MALRVLTLTGMLWLISGVWADEPPKKELLPMPREVPAPDVLPEPRVVPDPNIVYYVPPEPPPRFGSRSVWQLMSPNMGGVFRPRVVESPYGAYYLYNGQPYPWTTTRPTLYMPYVVD